MPLLSKDTMRLSTVGPPLALVCLVFVVLPIVVYLGNISESGVTLLTLAGVCVLVALTFLALLLGIRRLLPERARSKYDGLLSILTILFWAQGTLLVRDYGLLDGSSIDWNAFDHAGLIDTSVWVAGFIVGIALIRLAKHSLLLRAAGFLVAIQVASLVIDAVLKFEDVRIQHGQTYNSDPAQFYEFSRTQNIIHILVDGFQSDVFADLIVPQGETAKYAEMFTGFTYFKETLGIFPYTQFALPALLTGKTYQNKETKNDFLNRTMTGPSILSVAAQHGFDIDIAAAGTYLYGQYAKIPHNSIFLIDSLGTVNPTVTSLLELADVTAFRLAPHMLKRFVYNDQKWIFQPMVVERESFKYAFFQNTHFLMELTRNLSAARDEPVYKYIHVSNTHRPMVANSNCEYAGKTFGDTRTTLTIQSKCTLDTLSELFDKLKAAGIYDSSLIIVHADHGGWVPNRRQGKPVRLATNRLAPPWMTSLASPLLAIKPPRSDGPLEISEASVSLLDLPDTVSDIMQFDANFRHTSAFGDAATKNRIRRFYFYPWQRNEWEAEYTETIQEFMILGSHYESEWVLRSVHKPPLKN